MLDPVLINILVDNRRTSIKLEQPMWDAIDEICRIERMTRNDLFTTVWRTHPDNLTSAMRVLVMNYFRVAATETGHATAGHGNGGALSIESLKESDSICVL